MKQKNALIIQQILNINLSKLKLTMDYEWLNINNDNCYGAFLKSDGKNIVALIFPKNYKIRMNA